MEKVTIIKDNGKVISERVDVLPEKVNVKEAEAIEKEAGKTILRRTYQSDKVSGVNRKQAYNMGKLMPEYAKLFRNGKPLPKTFNPQSPDYLKSTFKIKGFEYGTWLNEQDRQNYLFALGASLYDMAKLSGLPLNFIGLNGLLSICFGSRGRGGAMAHFEPTNFIINLTRHRANQNLSNEFEPKEYPKAWRFLFTSGVSSFAHEYGHALDFYFGLYVDQTKSKKGFNTALSYGRETFSTPKLEEGKPLTILMEKLLNKIMWNDDLTEYTAFYTELRELAEERSDYWIRRTEIFARAFEQYIQYQAEKAGFNNKSLTKKKYDGGLPMYMKREELERILPEMKALLKAMSKVNLLKNE